jgi:carnitine 3-dehydrogenase
LELKRKLFQQVQAHASEAAILASSSAGLTAAELQGCAARPGQILRACPVNPVYLIPQVLLEGTERTDPGMIARARQVLADIGLAPVEALSGAGLVATATEGAAGLAERDNTLVALLRSLKARGGPLAAPILAHEVALAPPAPDPETSEPPLTLDQQVPISWVDYNGHMNEARYLTAFSAAADRLLLWAGMDAACIAAGQSVFTVETHIRYLAEVHIGDRIRVTTRVLQGGGRKFHIWHAMSVGDILCATGEQLLLHVDLTTRRSTLPPPAMARWLSRAAASHAARPLPEGMGRHVGQRSAT